MLFFDKAPLKAPKWPVKLLLSLKIEFLSGYRALM